MSVATSTRAGIEARASYRNAALTGSSSTSSRRGGAACWLIKRSVKTDYPCSMRRSTGSFKLLLALALCVAGPAQAKLLTAKVARLDSGAGSMQGVQLSLDWPEGASSGTLRIRADTLDFPSISYRAKRIDWQCPLQRRAPSG